MKKYLWTVILAIVIVAVGGYILVSRTKDSYEIKRVDDIHQNEPAEDTSSSELLVQDKNDSGYTGELSENANLQTTNGIESFDMSETTNSTTEQAKINDVLPSSGDLPGNTMSNIANGGNVASDRAYEYIRYSDDNCLYRLNIANSEAQKIINKGACYINIVGDWIYYIERLEDEPYYGGIFKIKKDGSSNQELLAGSYRYLIVNKDTVYFLDKNAGYKIFSMKTDGSNLRCIYNDACDQMLFDNGFLYFKHYPDMYSLSMNDTSAPPKIVENVDSFVVYNNMMFYTKRDNVNQLIKQVVGEDEKTVLVDNLVPPYNISNERIYFMKQAEGLIYSMDLDGESINPIPNSSDSNKISAVVEEYIYYWVDDEAPVLMRIKVDGSSNVRVEDLIANAYAK